MIQLHVIKTKIGGKLQKMLFFPPAAIPNPISSSKLTITGVPQLLNWDSMLGNGSSGQAAPGSPRHPQLCSHPPKSPLPHAPPMTLCPCGPSRFLPVCPSAATGPPALETGSASFASSIMFFIGLSSPRSPRFLTAMARGLPDPPHPLPHR